MFALPLTRQLRLLRAPVQRASCTGAASFACARLAAGAAAQFARSPRHAELERRRIPGKEGTIWANGVYPLTIDFSEVCLPCEPRSVCAALSACFMIAPHVPAASLCMLLMRF